MKKEEKEKGSVKIDYTAYLAEHLYAEYGDNLDKNNPIAYSEYIMENLFDSEYVDQRQQEKLRQERNKKINWILSK